MKKEGKTSSHPTEAHVILTVEVRMEDSFTFFIGLLLGLLLGGLGVYAMVKIRGWFSSSEVHRLHQENRQLQKRIEQKDRHIDEMLRRAENVAREMSKGRTKSNDS